MWVRSLRGMKALDQVIHLSIGIRKGTKVKIGFSRILKMK